MVSILRLFSFENFLNRLRAVSEKSMAETLNPFWERNTELRPSPQAMSSTDPALKKKHGQLKTVLVEEVCLIVI